MRRMPGMWVIGRGNAQFPSPSLDRSQCQRHHLNGEKKSSGRPCVRHC